MGLRAWTMGHTLLLFVMFHAGTCLKFTVMVPKLLYYDSVTTAAVSAVDVEPHSKAVLNLEYRGNRNSSILLNSTTLEFLSDGSQTWNVSFTWDQLYPLGEKSVVMIMSSRLNESQSRMVLNFAPNFGYIFIQTDKPIYTPTETVKFRVIAVDEQQKLAKHKIRVDLKNNTQMLVDRKVMTAYNAFTAQEFQLPVETKPGNWTIAASFDGVDILGGGHTVSFEVREYVLPKFFTRYDIRPEVITNTTKHITIDGTAKYFHNKAVEGKAELLVGTWDPVRRIQFHQNRHYSITLTDGVFNQEIPVDSVLPPNSPRDMRLHKDVRLYVRLNITESATAESDVNEDTSTSFSYSDYVVDFKSSKEYFKPAFPYTLKFRVSKNEGLLDPSLKVNIRAHFTSSGHDLLEDSGTFKLDQLGKMTREYNNIPGGADRISFLVTFPDQIESEGYTHIVTKYLSKHNQSIHIMYHVSKKKREAGVVHLNYTKPSRSNTDVSSKPDSITVLVLSKGHIVYTTSTNRTHIGSSYVQLPHDLYKEITPRMRIVAYYLYTNSEYIIDSLVVDTKHVCVEEIYLHGSTGQGASGLYKPSDSYTLKIDGGNNMRVGLVAVDSAVFYLNNKQTLTRSLMFTQLGSHDIGSASGGGSTMEDILSNSGLQYMSMTVTEMKDHGTNRLSPLMDIPHYEIDHAYRDTTHPVKEFKRAFMGKSMLQNRGLKVHSTLPQTQRPQTARKYFPESWLFEEIYLSDNGTEDLNLELPDSTTTWAFVAVGLSADRGICVSHPEMQPVVKLFFSDLRLPYKVKRLEQVTIMVTIHNYNTFTIVVEGKITGSDGLCFLANETADGTSQETTFTISIEPKKSVGRTAKVIPLRKGNLSIVVDLKSQKEQDIVEKTLHVVPEGQRVKKSITFVLDPEAKHAAIETNRKKKITFNNIYDDKNKTQQTTIDLALPVEVVSGTEFCSISAFGDLMGDIINHSVMKSRNLIETPLVNAEKVLGDLAPTVYALLYANISGLMDETLKDKGRTFVKLGVVSLLETMLDSYSFALTPKSKPATWLTAFVLKTLCHASSLAFIDRERLIDKGFNWLSKQVDQNGIITEQDWRLTLDPLENRIMLSAEVLIAILECQRSEKDQHLTLQGNLSSFLEENLEQIKLPMVLAKVTYALMLIDNGSDEYKDALIRLDKMKRRNSQGNLYWSNNVETDENQTPPLWYHIGAQASAIEATAYALIVYVHNGDPNTDAIADWLVGQRNQNGAFIGAMDSTVAIQALSNYSLHKHRVKVDLHCNVSSDRLINEYFHSFKFTEKNATHSESLNNVPVGEILEVITKGQGLGQMQVNVEYNVPIEKNSKCTFNIQVNATKADTQLINDARGDPICASCKIGCPRNGRPGDFVAVKMDRAVVLRACKKKGPPFPEKSICKKLQKRKNKNQSEKRHNSERKHRQARSVQHNQVFSKKLICIHMCLKHKKRGVAGPIQVQIEMLTGYQPIADDIKRINEMPNVRFAAYENSTEVLKVQFNEISCKKKTCVTFRASAEATVDRLMPAVAEVTQVGAAEPQCVIDYNPPAGEESLQIFCSNMSNSNKGECKCLSGLCSHCKPTTKEEFNFYNVQQLVCSSKVVYKLQIGNKVAKDNWAEIDARVISLNKTGIDNVTVGSSIKLTTPSFCQCPGKFHSDIVYLLSADAEKFVDKRGKNMFRYLLNEKSVFLNVAEEGEVAKEDEVAKEGEVAGEGEMTSSIPTVSYLELHSALSDNNNCQT